MKRVIFSPIIDTYRGSLSGAQSLKYARDYNKAWESPAGKTNPARNYHANYIAKVSKKTGEPYIVIRKRSAVTMSDKMIKQMAAQGGASAIFNSLLTSSQYSRAMAYYLRMIEIGTISEDVSFRKFWWSYIFPMVMQGTPSITPTTGTISVQIDNPWMKTSGTLTTPVSNAILRKFWMQLAGSFARVLTIEDRGIKKTMLWKAGDDWSNVLSSNYNVLHFTSGQGNSIMLGNLYINFIDAGGEVTMTTNDEPQIGMFTSEDYIH